MGSVGVCRAAGSPTAPGGRVVWRCGQRCCRRPGDPAGHVREGGGARDMALGTQKRWLRPTVQGSVWGQQPAPASAGFWDWALVRVLVSVCVCVHVHVSACACPCVRVPVTSDCLSAPNPPLIPGAVPARRGPARWHLGGISRGGGAGWRVPPRGAGDIPAPRPPAAAGPSIFLPGAQCCASPVEGAGGTRPEEAAPLAGARGAGGAAKDAG